MGSIHTKKYLKYIQIKKPLSPAVILNQIVLKKLKD